jgi:hypothetical protein
MTLLVQRLDGNRKFYDEAKRFRHKEHLILLILR